MDFNWTQGLPAASSVNFENGVAMVDLFVRMLRRRGRIE
jgi:hypothetical protein